LQIFLKTGALTVCGGLGTEHERPELVSFDEIDYNDPKQLRAAQQSMVREQWIRVQSLNVIRRALEKCFQTQGENQYENCKDLAGTYLKIQVVMQVVLRIFFFRTIS
jgi:hypothetical protein